MIRDLGQVVERENAKIGIFITLAEATGPMVKEAIKAGFYETEYGKFPKLQFLTIEELIAGKKIEMPWIIYVHNGIELILTPKPSVLSD